MNIEQNLQKAEQILAPWNREATRPETNRLDASIVAENLRPAVTAMHEAHWGYLSAITGLDLGVESGQMEALYHFCNGPAIATLRIRLPRTNEATLPTIEDIIPPATFFERELHEMLGFKIDGAQSNDRLFISDDWPEDVYPLRADFNIEQAKPMEGRHADEAPEVGVVGGNKFVIPIGPQHPALKEPGHFEFTVDGEIVTAARMRLGYAHRGIEKAAESRNWIQNLYLFERICGICSHTHAMAYSLGVEKLAHVEVPAYPDRVFSGRVERIGGILDEATRTVKVRVVVRNPEGLLRAGMFARVRLLDGSAEQVVAIPAEAVLEDEGRSFVFVPTEPPYFVRRPVTTGRAWDEYVEITQGLADGDVVVTRGAFTLKSDVLRSKMGAGCAD